MATIMDEFIRLMPKIELHAHLNGSLSYDALLKLGEIKYGKSTHDFKKLCNSFRIAETPTLTECFQKFKIAHFLTNTEQLLELAVFLVIEEFFLDNVVYLELRTTPKCTEIMSKKQYLETVLKAIISAEYQMPGILVKLIPSIDRSKGPADARDTINTVISLLDKYKHIIRGIDFSGNPDIGSFEEYKDILTDARLHNLKLAIHCGEVENEKEVYDMLSFGIDRCGHGTFIKNDNFDLLRSRGIPIECCLTSNVKCGTVESFEKHQFYQYYSQKLPVVICTDDCGIFNTNLTSELIIATKTFNLIKKDHLQLAYTAIENSFTNNYEKSQLKNKVDKYFENVKLCEDK